MMFLRNYSRMWLFLPLQSFQAVFPISALGGCIEHKNPSKL